MFAPKAAAGEKFRLARAIGDPLISRELSQLQSRAFRVVCISRFVLNQEDIIDGGATRQWRSCAAQGVTPVTIVPAQKVIGRCDQQEWCEVTVKVGRKALCRAGAGQAAQAGGPDGQVRSRSQGPRYLGTSSEIVRVDHVSKSAAARTVKFGGAAAKMEQAFGVHLLREKHDDILYRGRVGEIHIPADSRRSSRASSGSTIAR